MKNKIEELKPTASLKRDAINLSQLNGIPAHEEKIVEYIKDSFKKSSDLRSERDGLGSLAIIKKGTNETNNFIISFSAHMDEVGFMITKIDSKGFIKFTPIGGWWAHVVLGKLLTITTQDNREIVGVVGAQAPHLLKPAEAKQVVELDKMFIDVGANSDKEVERMGIKVGDMITPTNSQAYEVGNDRIIAKAHDDRCSIAVGMEVMRRLLKVKHEANVIFIATTQEEVGLRGARTSSYKWTSNIGFAIDVTIANDTPGIEEKDTVLGSGVALSLFDRSVIGNKKLIQHVQKIAENYEIPYTFDGLSAGGTDSGAIHLTKEGIINMTLSIPSRYMHSHNSMVDLKDMQATVELIVNFIKDFTFEDLESMEYK